MKLQTRIQTLFAKNPRIKLAELSNKDLLTLVARFPAYSISSQKALEELQLRVEERLDLKARKHERLTEYTTSIVASSDEGLSGEESKVQTDLGITQSDLVSLTFVNAKEDFTRELFRFVRLADAKIIGSIGPEIRIAVKADRVFQFLELVKKSIDFAGIVGPDEVIIEARSLKQENEISADEREFTDRKAILQHEEYDSIPDESGIVEEILEEDVFQLLVKIQEGDEVAWTNLERLYVPKLEIDSLNYAERYNKKFALDTPKLYLQTLCEYFVSATSEDVRKRIMSYELSFQKSEQVYNYWLTMIINRIRTYMKPYFHVEENGFSLDFIDEDILSGNYRKNEHRVILEEQVQEIIEDLLGVVDNPVHVQLYLDRIMYSLSSKELAEKYNYSSSYIDNITARIRNQIRKSSL